MTDSYDVLIVGGGLAGASLACALSGRGLRIGVVEAVELRASDQPSYDDRSLALAYASQRIFAAIGVWQRLGERPTPLRHIHVSQRGHFGVTRIHAGDLGVPALGYVVPGRAIGAAVLGLLETATDIDLICPARLERLASDERAVTAEAQVDGDRRSLRARLLVGADGTGSVVRRALGIEAKTFDYAQTAVIANVTPERPRDGWAFERLTTNGPVAMLPLSGGRYGCVQTVPTGHEQALLECSEAEFLELLQERFGYRLGRLARAGKRASYPLKLVEAERQTASRAVLIGNAAHTIHPVSAQGFNLGLRDVAALAELVAAAARDGADVGDAALIERYAAWRAPDHRRTIRYTDTLVRVFAGESAPVGLVRGLGMLAVDLCPPLKQALAQRAMGLVPGGPRLARGAPLAGPRAREGA